MLLFRLLFFIRYLSASALSAFNRFIEPHKSSVKDALGDR
jgi:hypothetical protein